MSAFKIPPIDWSSLDVSANLESWDDDRLRKFGRIRSSAEELLDLGDILMREEEGLYQCRTDILRRHPKAADWYIGLACYAQKTLKNSAHRAAKFGLSVTPDTFLKKMRTNPEAVNDSDLQAFSNWMNSEIADLISSPLDDQRLYTLHVAMIAGGRIIGQGQNEGGNLAVIMLKDALLNGLGPLSKWEYLFNDNWLSSTEDVEATLQASLLRYCPTDTLLDFSGGGNKPDITIERNGIVLLVGEIKGRKDLSNTWESWMPQVADHLRTWATEYPEAVRGVFMTVITAEMIQGASKQGTQRTGLKGLNKQGLLDYAYNLSLLKPESQTSMYRDFCAFLDTILDSSAQNKK